MHPCELRSSSSARQRFGGEPSSSSLRPYGPNPANSAYRPKSRKFRTVQDAGAIPRESLSSLSRAARKVSLFQFATSSSSVTASLWASHLSSEIQWDSKSRSASSARRRSSVAGGKLPWPYPWIFGIIVRVYYTEFVGGT